MTFFASMSRRWPVPRLRRSLLGVLEKVKWCFAKALACFTLPDFFTWNRFLAALRVFIFGIADSLNSSRPRGGLARRSRGGGGRRLGLPLFLLCSPLPRQIPCALGDLGVRGEDHEHLPAFHAGHLLHHPDFLHVLDDVLEQRLAELLVGDLPAAEHDGDARLVPLLEEALHVPHLELVVVLLGLRSHLHLLEVNHDLLLLCLRSSLLLLVLEAAVI